MNINNIRLCDLCRPFPQMSNLADQQMPHTCWQKCRKPADKTKRWQTCRTTADKDADMETKRQSQCTTTLWSCQFHMQVQIHSKNSLSNCCLQRLFSATLPEEILHCSGHCPHRLHSWPSTLISGHMVLGWSLMQPFAAIWSLPP